MAIATLTENLVLSDFETIEKMAEENYGPRDIAKALSVSVRDFLHLWRDHKSQIREAYERGVLQIDIKKQEKLIDLITKENVTAIQIHDKNQKIRRFEDARLDVFGI